ncbi:MAG: hypothetical protein AW10_03373 [Candidatus Accumulibacter appositus]|uniref:Uncharacterized protein n=1 Tax=Candidatus Accumulibacter appositus TaxID=1454003 RepID=A0A011QGP9_9PROT|nr:MAG: hypothetical protein AW10_03373 [Candidatus Accumulibacter appositus]
MLQGSVVKGDGQVRGRRGVGDALLEFGAALNRDAIAVARHGHAQGGFQTALGGATGYLQLVAIVPDGGRADAVDEGPLLGDAVLLRFDALPALLTAVAGDGVPLQATQRGLAGTQGRECFAVAFGGLAAQPVGPGLAPVLVVNGLLFFAVLLVDVVDFVLQRPAGEGIERLPAQARATHQFDRGPLQAPAALGGFDQPALAVTGLCPLDRARSAVALLLGAVPGVKLDRISTRPEGARPVLPGRLVGLVRQPLG